MGWAAKSCGPTTLPDLRFGLALPQYDYSLPGDGSISWAEVRDWAQRAEELGFDSVWLSDHLFLDVSKYGGSDEVQSAMECFTTLAALSATTRRIRLGSLVVCNDLRSPSLVAKMAATIDVISGGRLTLGMGAGWYEPEYTAAGIRFDPPNIRVDRFEEALQIISGMMRGRGFSFEGMHHAIDDAINLPASIQQPFPLWVGGKKDRMVRLAGRYATGFNAVWAWTPEDLAGRLKVLDSSARKSGRDPSEITRSVGLYTLPGDDDADLWARWERYLAVSPPGTGDGLSLDAWRRDKLAGTPAEMADTIGHFAALGVEEVILGFGILPFQLADASAVDAFARDVFPIIGDADATGQERK